MFSRVRNNIILFRGIKTWFTKNSNVFFIKRYENDKIIAWEVVYENSCGLFSYLRRVEIIGIKTKNFIKAKTVYNIEEFMEVL